MKSAPIITLVLITIVSSSCERKAAVASTQAAGEVATQAVSSVEELRKRTSALYERARADSSVYDSKEWYEVMESHGPAYKRQLIQCIQESDSIAITEHSDRVDFYEPNRPLPENPPFYEYQTTRLTDDQKAAFLRTVEEMDATTEYTVKRCGFEPHHRLDFFRSGRDPTSISICFKCDKSLWNEAEFTEPKGLMAALRLVVESAELKPERDWRALAKARSVQTTPSDGDKPSD